MRPLSRCLTVLPAALMLCAVRPLSAQRPAAESKIDSLLARMTLEEKLGQLNQVSVDGQPNAEQLDLVRKGLVGSFFNLAGADATHAAQHVAVTESRLHIPLILGLDVIHGYRTIFPIPLGEAASWDPEAVEAAAHVAAKEAAAAGVHWTFAPMVDIARDPRWGRVAEGAGEDPYLGSKVARAMVKGYQGNSLSADNTVMACVKHFALYGAAEGGRDYNTVDMSRIKMYEYYLPPYKAAVDAGSGSVMSSFNEIDGIPATGNKWLMTDLLRKQWGFKGFVVTDYTAINEMIDHGMGDLQTVSALALNAGTDMDMVGEGYLTTLKKSLAEGKTTQKQIDAACRRILEAKYKLGLFDDPYRYCNPQRAAKEVLSADKRAAAREFGIHSTVLLKN